MHIMSTNFDKNVDLEKLICIHILTSQTTHIKYKWPP